VHPARRQAGGKQRQRQRGTVMARVGKTTEITSEQPGVYHIPGVHNMQQTLCGYIDCGGQVDHDAADHPCNCKSCFDALNAIKALRFSKDYFDPQKV
jgi:hypothetical protein